MGIADQHASRGGEGLGNQFPKKSEGNMSITEINGVLTHFLLGKLKLARDAGLEEAAKMIESEAYEQRTFGGECQTSKSHQIWRDDIVKAIRALKDKA